MILTRPASRSSSRPGKLQVTPCGRDFRHPQGGGGHYAASARARPKVLSQMTSSAAQSALRQLWPLEGYLLREALSNEQAV
jgi:hypothetical protein